MKRIQKIAWAFVIIIPIAVALAGISTTFLYLKYGFPKASAGLGFLGIAGLAGLAPAVFRKDDEPAIPDERDQMINKKAAIAGFATAYGVVGLACMLPFSILGPKAVIEVRWLPMIFAAAGLSHFFAYSLAILIQYGRGGKENE